jgi:hypothetical protein
MALPFLPYGAGCIFLAGYLDKNKGRYEERRKRSLTGSYGIFPAL